MTLGGPRSATIGMRVMDLEMRTWYGAPAYFVLGAVHAVAFWVTVSIFTPLILLVCFFNDRRRLLHDMVVGTIVINNAVRASSLRARANRAHELDGGGVGAILATWAHSIDCRLTAHDPAFARHTAILSDRTVALPVSAGKEERKVFTHLVGDARRRP